MPNILHAMHSSGAYSQSPAEARASTLLKRDLDGGGFAAVLIIVAVGAVLATFFLFKWIKSCHERSYRRNPHRRWSVHHQPLQHGVHTMRSARAHHADRDLEAGLEMPQRPTRAYKSAATRGPTGRADRYRPSQTLGQYVRESAQATRAARGASETQRSRGAPSAAEYFGQDGGGAPQVQEVRGLT